MDGENESKCDATCCVRDLVLLYEGEEFRKYLEYHVANYRQLRRDISITLREIHPSSPSAPNVFEHSINSDGLSLLDYINGIDNTGSYSLPYWDGVVFPAHLVGALKESNRLLDLSDYLLQHQNSKSIDWLDIQPYYRSQTRFDDKSSTARASSSSLWESQDDQKSDASRPYSTLYVPLDGDVIALYYRKDLFEKHKIKIPKTWDDYLEVARFFHDKPWGPNNTTMIGSCVARTSKADDGSNNMYAYWASLILSTMTQTMETSMGFLLDPETVEPILGDAMEKTLQILAQEATLSEGSGDRTSHSLYDTQDLGGELHGLQGLSWRLNDLRGLSWKLNEGSCAMTLSWANQLTIPIFHDLKNLNKVGVAKTPGSEYALNRTSGNLESCTPELCPYGIHYDGIGIVNRPSYAAYGGWVGGVSIDATNSNQRDMADFFSYISNPVQSISDMLPNERSHFVSPYRYSQTAASVWVGAGFDKATASQYTETIKEVNSENTASEIRISQGAAIREIINQEVNAYLLSLNGGVNVSQSDDFLDYAALRSEVTTNNMDKKIRDIIADGDSETIIKNYQSSLSYPEGYEDVSMNYINRNYRDTGWGAAVLICFSSIAVILWILWNRKRPVMQAFQPFLLIQSAVGLFFMGATLIPLGFDDSLFDKATLDITCMATPWIYVFGYTIFFSSIYSKIQVCTEIYTHPGKYERMMVQPKDALKLFSRLFLLNGVLLSVWTIVDPLTWSRIEKTTNGSTFPDGTVESYGSCKGEKSTYVGFAIALLVFNLICCFVAMLQALRCRLLVLEYHQMQWLQLCIVPFFEAWIIGGPVIFVLYEQPSAQYATFLMIIASSSIASAFAIFAPKEWYVRKSVIFGNKIESDAQPSLPGVKVLKHPKLESQKHVSNLQNRLIRYNTSNTELAIDIRVLQEKFRLLTEKEKLAVVGGLFAKEISESQKRMSLRMLEDSEKSLSETRESDVFDMNLKDDKYKNHGIDTVIARSLNSRVSELSIDMDDLKQIRVEEGKLFSQVDDQGLFSGKSVRSIVEMIDSVELVESTSASHLGSKEETCELRSEEAATDDRLQTLNQPEQNNCFIENAASASINDAGSSTQMAVRQLDGYGSNRLSGVEEEEGSLESKSGTTGQESASTCSENHHDTAEKLNCEMEDLNEMIESDHIQDLQMEAILMAEEFKLRMTLLEDISDLQSGISKSAGEDFDKKIEKDNIQDLQSEVMMTAENSKPSNSCLEIVSDVRPCSSENITDNLKSNGSNSPDVSNATATSTSTAMTENCSKGFSLPSDVISGPLSESNQGYPGTTVMSSAGESSGAHVLASKKACVDKSEGNPRHQHAGEPSSDCRPPLKSNEIMITSDVCDGTDTVDTIDVLVSSIAIDPETQPKECEPVSPMRSSISSTSAPVSAPAGLDSQLNTSNNIGNNSISIEGWKPIGAISGLLADFSDSQVSDSQTSSSIAGSPEDSISSLEVVPVLTHPNVQLGKDVEEVLSRHGFEARSDITTNDKNVSDKTKISSTRQKKRDLEAIRRSYGPSSP